MVVLEQNKNIKTPQYLTLCGGCVYHKIGCNRKTVDMHPQTI
ncbi:MAG: hypothetical protein ACRCSG_04065 [Cellulosilyticaceae bacterium]